MAYACPVCAQPQVDAEHLANHLAFTAITGDDDHEQWLDSTVDEWGQLGQAELAAIVVEHAESTEFPVDLDADASGSGGHQHGHGDADHDHAGHGDGTRSPDHDHDGHYRAGVDHTDHTDHADHDQHAGAHSSSAPGNLDDEAQDVLAEARELTRRMQADGEVEETDEADGEGDPEPSDSETQ